MLGVSYNCMSHKASRGKYLGPVTKGWWTTSYWHSAAKEIGTGEGSLAGTHSAPSETCPNPESHSFWRGIP